MEDTKKILEQLLKYYTTVYSLDYRDDSAVAIKLSPQLTDQIAGETFKWSTGMRKLTRAIVREEDWAVCDEALGPESVAHGFSESDDPREFIYRKKDGKWCRGVVMPVETTNGITEKAMVMMREDHQLELNKNELNSREKQLKKALKEAEHANKSKSVFLSNMSHDIRTPMNAILGFTELAFACLDDKEQIRDYLVKIMGASNHLLSLVNSVLDMSRIESGKIQLEERQTNLSKVIEDVYSMCNTEAKAKGLNFEVEAIGVIDENVICDTLRLNQVLLNLLSNALKFTKIGGTIRLSVEQKPCPTEGYATYEFKVSDTGIGMGPEFVEHIWEPFERESTSTVSGIQGTGLGMAITKNIIDMMEGEIEIESEEGKGSTFTILLDLKIAGVRQKTEEEKHKQATQGNGKKILLVEDNELNAEIAFALLEGAGYDVEHAGNGQIAVTRMMTSKTKEFAAILMDIQMPVMDGYEATRQIRNITGNYCKNIPILAMTANAFEEDVRKAREAGMNDHISKPVNRDKLLETLARYA